MKPRPIQIETTCQYAVDPMATLPRIYFPHQTALPKTIGCDDWICLRTSSMEYYGRAWRHPSSHTAYTSVSPCISRSIVCEMPKDGRWQYMVSPLEERPVTAIACTLQPRSASHEDALLAATSSPAEKLLGVYLSGFLIYKGFQVSVNIDGATHEYEVLQVSPSRRLCVLHPWTRLTLANSRVATKMDHMSLPLSLAGSGNDRIYRLLYELIQYPRMYKEQCALLRVELPRGILLSGPPGVGKTFLVSRLAAECGLSLTTVNGPELLSPLLGQSEENIRQLFSRALRRAEEDDGAILFIDEIDSIAMKRGSDSSNADVRIVAQLLTLLDGVKSQGKLIILAATNRPNSIDPALRRPGRFDREFVIEAPATLERLELLKGLTRSFALAQDVDLAELAKDCVGYVAADLAALCYEAALSSLSRLSPSNSAELPVTAMDDFVRAHRRVGPSLLREYSLRVDPLMTWDRIGGLDAVKSVLSRCIEWPLTRPETFRRLGLEPPKGILLHGPPGCSKTSIAKALANEGGFSFYSISGAAVYSAMVGESERLLRMTFTNARRTRPSIIFIDEIDALAGKRGSESGAADGTADVVQERILSTMLNELDGVELIESVIVVAATNRIEAIDAALLRPGRFGKIIEIPLPDEKGRLDILAIVAGDKPLGEDVDLAAVAAQTVGFSGADLANIIQEAAFFALRRNSDWICRQDIEQALAEHQRVS